MNRDYVITELAPAIRAAWPERTFVTTRPEDAGAQLAAGVPVAIIGPPSVEFPTYHKAEATWTVVVVAPTAHDRDAGWDQLDPLVAALRIPLDVNRLEPAGFAPPESAQLEHPAYLLTFTTQHRL